MKVLMIGGTGIISSACCDLALQRGMDLTILNRSVSTKFPVPSGAQHIVGDIHADQARLAEVLRDRHFDVVVDWVAYTPADIEHDIRLFSGKTGQFVFISSASAYQKPPAHYLIPKRPRSKTPSGSTRATRSPSSSA